MAETPSPAASSGDSFDLSQFYQVFFEEAGENLELMEQQLLAIDIAAPDVEMLNSIFRCAHSVKGGAATFGFKDVAELTHHMETLLDKLRRHELALDSAMVDVLLQAGDALKAQLARHQHGESHEAVDTSVLVDTIRAMAHGQARPAAAAPAVAAVAATPAPATGATRTLELRVGPLEAPAAAASLVDVFHEIEGLGTIEPLDGGESADGMRRFKVVTDSSDEDLIELFSFHVSREHVVLLPLGPGYGFHAGAPGAPADADPAFGFFDNAPGAPSSPAGAGGAR